MKSFKEIIVPALILMVLCFVVSATLVGTYHMTKDTIATVAKEQADASRKEVLPEADSFTERTDITLDEGVVEVYEADNGSGFVITSTDKGFGGTITFMTSFDPEGKIVSVKLIAHTETPGLGTKVEAPDHVAQYVGQTNTDSVIAITGATITSNAMKRSVDKAVAQYAKLGGGQ